MLTIGQVGLGRWGTNIARTLQQDIANVQLVVADTPQQASALTNQALDGVIIATPGSTHAKLALPFIQAGIPTFIEKPLTTSLADAKQLADAAQASGALVLVGHIHLYNPAYHQTKQLVKKAGSIRSLYFEGMNNGPIRSDMSALWDWSPHDVAMAIDLMGQAPLTVQAWGQAILKPKTTRYDNVQLKLTFAHNVVAIINNSWLSPTKRKQVTISGKKSIVVYDDATPQQKVTVYADMRAQVRGQIAQERQPTISHPAYGKKSPLELELCAFLHTIKTGQPPVTDLSHALQVITILDAAERSIKRAGALMKL